MHIGHNEILITVNISSNHSAALRPEDRFIRFHSLPILMLIAALLSGCATTTGLTPSDVEEIRNSSTEGVLLISLGRVERPMPYFPVVYYKLLLLDRQTGKLNVVGALRSEVFDFRYFNGMHFSGTGKQAVVNLVRIPAGRYWLAGYKRVEHPIILSLGGAVAPVASSSMVRVGILYRVEVFPGKLTYAGELISNSFDLESNASVTVSDEFERDINFVAQEHPYIRNLESRKSIAMPQE